jgi:hypothetical protein
MPAEVVVRLQVKSGRHDATRVVIAEEMAMLGESLLENFRQQVAVRSGRTKDSMRMDPPVVIAGFWALKFWAYWTIRFLVKGSKAHDIYPGKMHRAYAEGGHVPELRMSVGGSFVFASHVHHPGTKKSRLVSTALARSLPGAAIRLRAKMGEAIASEIRSAV